MPLENEKDQIPPTMSCSKLPAH